MTNYTVETLNLGPFTTESGEMIDNLQLRYEHVGYAGSTACCSVSRTYW